MRDPNRNPTPFDLASFYIEELKYGPGEGKRELVGREELVEQFKQLLAAAHIESMTGEELFDALEYYGESLARSLGMPKVLALSCFIDGVMHGIAFGGGVLGPIRNPRSGDGLPHSGQPQQEGRKVV